MNEIEYKKHPDYNILCGSDGNVYYANKAPIRCKTHIIKGYKRFHLDRRILPNKLYSHVAIHRLICTAFHGLPKGNEDRVYHKDGNKLNNKPNNLKWASRTFMANKRYIDPTVKIDLICCYNPYTDKIEGWFATRMKAGEFANRSFSVISKAVKYKKMSAKRYFLLKSEHKEYIKQIRRQRQGIK